MTKLLCYGDVHLGQGSQYPNRLRDQADVLDKIADLAIERAVDGVLNAGDTFEGPSISPEQLDVFARFVRRLREAGIPHLAVTGNSRHDAAVRETNGMAIFNHIAGIQVFSQPTWGEFAGCAVAVLPWVHPGRLIARAGRDVPRDEINTVVGELLVEVARDLHDTIATMPISGDLPKILLTHWSISGTSLPAGLPVDELREPVIPVDALEAVGFDHIVAGHIHKPQTVGSTGFYTGSPMPLNHGEAGVGHGVAILHVGERDEIDFPGAEFVEIDSPEFITLDLGSDADVDWMLGHAVAAAVGGDTDRLDDAIVRVRFTATKEQMQRIDIAAIREPLLEVARSVKIEATLVRGQRARVAGVDEQLDEMQALEMWMQSADVVDELREILRAKTRTYMELVA